MTVPSEELLSDITTAYKWDTVKVNVSSSNTLVSCYVVLSVTSPSLTLETCRTSFSILLAISML